MCNIDNFLQYNLCEIDKFSQNGNCTFNGCGVIIVESISPLAIADELTVPTVEDLVARARALVPLLKERAAEDEKNGLVNPDTVRRMKEAGLFRVFQARRWDGYELGQRAFAEVQMTLAEGDMSVAWIFGVISLHSLHICLMEDQAAQDVWGEDSSVLIASPYMPGGIPKPVPGGYEISGRWAYSSGCDHCEWTFLGGIVDGTDGQDLRSFLLPRADAKIVGGWDVPGLQATGSQDIVVEKAFVPEHRTHKFIDGYNCQNPGRFVNPGAIYRSPFMLVFMRGITNSQIGALQAMVDLFKEYAREKVFVGTRTGRDPDAHYAVAMATAGIAEMKNTLFSNLQTMAEYAERNEPLPMEMRHLFRLQSAAVADRCVRLAEDMMTIAGGGGVYEKTSIPRIYRNMRCGRQHAAAQFRMYARTFGDLLMGGAPVDLML